MSVPSTMLEEFIMIGVGALFMLISFLLWVAGFIACLTRRPARGRTFLMIGFGLFAFVSILGAVTSAVTLLQLSENIPYDTYLFPFGAPVFAFGYQVLLGILNLAGVTLIVVGAMQSLRDTERE